MKQLTIPLAITLALSLWPAPACAKPAAAVTVVPPKPVSEVACYVALSITGGLINNLNMDKPKKSDRNAKMKASGPPVKFVQQWYLGRISTWSPERLAAENPDLTRKRIYKLNTYSQVQITNTCMRWAFYTLHTDFNL